MDVQPSFKPRMYISRVCFFSCNSDFSSGFTCIMVISQIQNTEPTHTQLLVKNISYLYESATFNTDRYQPLLADFINAITIPFNVYLTFYL